MNELRHRHGVLLHVVDLGFVSALDTIEDAAVRRDVVGLAVAVRTDDAFVHDRDRLPLPIAGVIEPFDGVLDVREQMVEFGVAG